jgi:hypothetical protein
MKILKNLAGIAAAGLLALAQPSQAQDLSFGPRLGFSVRKYSLSLNESKTVPVHPDDAGFLHGNTEVKAGNSGITPCAFNLGGEIRETWKNGLSLFGGIDWEFEATSGDYANNYGESGMFSMAKQSSDNRPDAYAAFVYDKVRPDGGSLIPFIGIGIRGDKCFADLEYALDTRKFEREWGNHRFCQEQAIGSEKYDTSGSRVALKLGIRQEEGLMCGLQLMLEDYNLEKSSGESAGKLKSYSAGFFVKKEF